MPILQIKQPTGAGCGQVVSESLGRAGLRGGAVVLHVKGLAWNSSLINVTVPFTTSFLWAFVSTSSAHSPGPTGGDRPMWGSVLRRSWLRSQPVSIWRAKQEDGKDARPPGAKRRGPEFEKSSYRRSHQHCVSWRIRVSQAKRGGKGIPGRGNHTQEGSEVREDQGTLCSFVTPNRCQGGGERVVGEP